MYNGAFTTRDDQCIKPLEFFGKAHQPILGTHLGKGGNVLLYGSLKGEDADNRSIFTHLPAITVWSVAISSPFMAAPKPDEMSARRFGSW